MIGYTEAAVRSSEAMVRVEIEDFDVTDRAAAKLWSHGISVDQLNAVLDHFWVATRNRKHRAASHILFGTDDQGRCLAVPIVATDDPLVWRPITAWHCKPHEAAILRRRRQR